MRKIKQLEEKLDKISEDIGIRYWVKVRENDYGSPPAYFDRATLKPIYDTVPINRAIQLLLDYLELRIERTPQVDSTFKIVKRGKPKN